MSDIYSPPNANLDITEKNKIIIRPRSVTIIASIFLLTAVIDFILSVKAGLVYRTYSIDATGAEIASGYKVEMLWLILYAIGAGLMRGGKFARSVACIFGFFALLVPGAIFIYYLYNTEAKQYFNNKTCDRCGDTKYINNSYIFNGVSCRQCSKTLDFKSA